MARTVSIGNQDFAAIMEHQYFYIDKTDFLKEWWENGDVVTLITRPRRFGKTLNMSMTEYFFSVKHAGRTDLFESLSIWKEEKYRQIQGTFPVISLSFANIKESSYSAARKKLCQMLTDLYTDHSFLLDSGILPKRDQEFFQNISPDMDDMYATLAIHHLSKYLNLYYKKKVIILLDEYDTPMQEAYMNGYWEKLTGFIRSLFNAAFKTNPFLERAIMTGITRVSRESVFSDLNHPEVVTTTSEKYEDAFGFTQQEVSGALKEYGLSEQEAEVTYWYDGFTFGRRTDIYNPWSILNFLDKGKLAAYWANTSSNSLIGRLIRSGSRNVKMIMEDLLNGKSFHTSIDEQIVYDRLDLEETALWSLLLAGGYLKVKHFENRMTEFGDWNQEYELELTNFEVKVMFRTIIQSWFAASRTNYNDFVKALLQGNLEAMNAYMNQLSETIFSSFDTGRKSSERTEPERFYHGLVLGLMMVLKERYVITSNRESGFGRYDVQLEPRRSEDDAILLEFKVRNPLKERSLEETVQHALAQITERDYAAALRQKGIPETRIRKYGFAFEGKRVLIGGAD
ncbi:MAG: AAA family ATPase [Lachnospiraceae bacterium]|nr:AAA family ATPase [Lachnospiraceae bacterium]